MGLNVSSNRSPTSWVIKERYRFNASWSVMFAACLPHEAGSPPCPTASPTEGVCRKFSKFRAADTADKAHSFWKHLHESNLTRSTGYIIDFKKKNQKTMHKYTICFIGICYSVLYQ